MYCCRDIFVVLVITVSVIEKGATDFFDFSEYDDPLQPYWGRQGTPNINLLTPSVLPFLTPSLVNTKNKYYIPYNTVCVARAPDGAQISGVCKSKVECLYSGGTISGKCGYTHSCCTYVSGCGSVAKERISYFTSGTNPENQQQPCTYRIETLNKDVCQIRLDIERMSLAPPPDIDGVRVLTYTCSDDAFSVEGSVNIPIICGRNDGQHLYVHLNRGGITNSVITLNVKLAGDRQKDNRNLQRPDWFIKVTQLQCPPEPSIVRTVLKKDPSFAAEEDFQLLAPPGCLQYFNNPFGTFRTFGFDNAQRDNSRYVINQHYATCFKRAIGDCGIRFNTDFFRFDLPINNMCVDYLEMPGVFGAVNNIDQFGRFCDDRTAFVPETVTSRMGGPFAVTFHSDFNSDNADVGYQINFQTMQQC